MFVSFENRPRLRPMGLEGTRGAETPCAVLGTLHYRLLAGNVSDRRFQPLINVCCATPRTGTRNGPAADVLSPVRRL